MAIFATPNPRFGPFGSKAITHGLVDGDLPGGEIEPKGGQKRGIYILRIFSILTGQNAMLYPFYLSPIDLQGPIHVVVALCPHMPCSILIKVAMPVFLPQAFSC